MKDEKREANGKSFDVYSGRLKGNWPFIVYAYMFTDIFTDFFPNSIFFLWVLFVSQSKKRGKSSTNFIRDFPDFYIHVTRVVSLWVFKWYIIVQCMVREILLMHAKLLHQTRKLFLLNLNELFVKLDSL